MPDNLPPPSIKFHYIKANLFRVIHVDGAIGGITPNRGIFVSLFSERSALPKMIEQELLPNGTLGEEKTREGKEGLVRDMEIGVMLSVDVAQKIAEFLNNQVKILKQSSPETAPVSDASEEETKVQ